MNEPQNNQCRMPISMRVKTLSPQAAKQISDALKDPNHPTYPCTPGMAAQRISDEEFAEMVEPFKPNDKETKLKHKESIPVGSDTDLVQENAFEVIVSMANGGHVRLVSKAPIFGFIKPE